MAISTIALLSDSEPATPHNVISILANDHFSLDGLNLIAKRGTTIIMMCSNTKYASYCIMYRAVVVGQRHQFDCCDSRTEPFMKQPEAENGKESNNHLAEIKLLWRVNKV